MQSHRLRMALAQSTGQVHPGVLEAGADQGLAAVSPSRRPPHPVEPALAMSSSCGFLFTCYRIPSTLSYVTRCPDPASGQCCGRPYALRFRSFAPAVPQELAPGQDHLDQIAQEKVIRGVIPIHRSPHSEWTPSRKVQVFLSYFQYPVL